MANMTFEQFMEKHNPFALKDEGNNVLYFEHYEDAYLHVMKCLRKEAPRGFVDIILFLCDHSGMDKSCAEDYCKDMRKIDFDFFNNQFFIVDWLHVRREKEKVETFIKGLHLITETMYLEGEFGKAWEHFVEKMKPVSEEEINAL